MIFAPSKLMNLPNLMFHSVSFAFLFRNPNV
jgi:hypothetical protein